MPTLTHPVAVEAPLNPEAQLDPTLQHMQRIGERLPAGLQAEWQTIMATLPEARQAYKDTALNFAITTVEEGQASFEQNKLAQQEKLLAHTDALETVKSADAGTKAAITDLVDRYSSRIPADLPDSRKHLAVERIPTFENKVRLQHDLLEDVEGVVPSYVQRVVQTSRDELTTEQQKAAPQNHLESGQFPEDDQEEIAHQSQIVLDSKLFEVLHLLDGSIPHQTKRRLGRMASGHPGTLQGIQAVKELLDSAHRITPDQATQDRLTAYLQAKRYLPGPLHDALVGRLIKRTQHALSIENIKGVVTRALLPAYDDLYLARRAPAPQSVVSAEQKTLEHDLPETKFDAARHVIRVSLRFYNAGFSKSQIVNYWHNVAPDHPNKDELVPVLRKVFGA